jgi:hypothetical protein
MLRLFNVVLCFDELSQTLMHEKILQDIPEKSNNYKNVA